MEACEYFAMAKLLLTFRKFPFYYNLLKLPMHSLCITCKVNTVTLRNRDGLAKVLFKDAVGWQLTEGIKISPNHPSPCIDIYWHLRVSPKDPSQLFQFKMNIWFITSWNFSKVNLGIFICSACGLHLLWSSLPTWQFKWKSRNYNIFSPVQMLCCFRMWTSPIGCHPKYYFIIARFFSLFKMWSFLLKGYTFFACRGSQGIQDKFELSILGIFVQYWVVWVFYSGYGVFW